MRNVNSVGSSSVDGLDLEVDLKLAVLDCQQRIDLLWLKDQNQKAAEIHTVLKSLCDKVIHPACKSTEG